MTGGIHASDATAVLAQSHLATAYGSAAGETCGTNLTGQDLGGLTLAPGVYCFDTSAQVTGDVTFDALGDPSAMFLIQTGTTLTTATGSAVILAGGATGNNLFWQIGSSATLGIGTAFNGSLLALTSVTLNTGASIAEGRALALHGSVTLDSNSIDASSSVPEPAMFWLSGTAFAMLWLRRRGH